MGFTHVRALLIPTNFYTDWVKPGYPYEKSALRTELRSIAANFPLSMC